MDKHKALKDWLENEPTVTHHSKNETRKHYNLVRKKKERDYYEEDNDSSNESEKLVINAKKDDAYRK